MKVQLNIKPDTLITAHKLLQHVYDLGATVSKQEKAYRSIGYDLAEKFEKLYKKKITSRDLFNTKKAIKVSIKFHEAWALELLLIDLIALAANSYQKHHIQTLIDQLNHKTC